MNKYTLYTSETCPKCALLSQKLTAAGIDFDTVTDVDVILGQGITSVPVLKTPDGNLMDYKQAWDWLNTRA